MPNWFCHNPHCPDCDNPQPIADLAIRPPCRVCGQADNGMVMWRVGGGPDDPSGRGRFASKARSEPSTSERGHGFYCQNPEQGGDTNGVGFALRLYPRRRLMFFINHDEVPQALVFLRFYSDLRITSDRLLVVVCDRNAKKRVKLPSKGKRSQLEQAMTVWAENNPLNVTEPGTRKKRNQFKQRQKVMDELLGPLVVSRHHALSRTRVSDPTMQVTVDLVELHLLATVVPWTGSTLAGNQLYQVVSNPQRSDWDKYDIANLLPIARLDHCYNVGQSTADVMAMTRLLGTSAILQLRDVFESQEIPAVDDFVNTFVSRLVRGPAKPILLLVWVRGVSGKERASLQQAGIGGDDVSEGNRGAVEAAKRNAHHVMTPQLFETLRQVVNRLNDHNGRRYILCPIGDEIRLNQYDNNSPLVLGEKPDNLIKFFGRLAEFSYSVAGRKFGPRRSAQSYFLYKLASHPALGGVVQFGLRSGAMETLMYLGYPTIYLEDLFEASGPRMAVVTNQGVKQAATDVEFHNEFVKAKGHERRLEALRQQREASQVALMPPSLRSIFAEMRDSGSALGEATEAVLAIHSQRGDDAPPFPFFFRLLTRNLIGLNPVGSGTVQRLAFRYGGTEQQARGTITDTEFDQLLALVSYCGESLEVYQRAIEQGDALWPAETYILRAFENRKRRR